jgi:hypothetical protein
LAATFDINNHCIICGIGKIQTKPFRIKKEAGQSNKQIKGLHWLSAALLIYARAKQLLEPKSMNDIKFYYPVIHENNDYKIGFLDAYY